jgi:hypothetical protein
MNVSRRDVVTASHGQSARRVVGADQERVIRHLCTVVVNQRTAMIGKLISDAPPLIRVSLRSRGLPDGMRSYLSCPAPASVLGDRAPLRWRSIPQSLPRTRSFAHDQ